MAVIGYARVSSNEQNIETQLDALNAAGCERIFEEKVSGTTRAGRDQLELALEFLRDGDTFIVTRLDRLGRSVADLQIIIALLDKKGVSFKATDQPIDTSSAAGKMFVDVLAAFAEFETNLRKERQLDGIARAKRNGAYKGRKATIDVAAVRELANEGIGASEIAKRLNIGRASVYRVLSA